jgi:hypothetical protein
MKRVSIEPVVGLGTNLVDSATTRAEHALGVGEGHVRDLLGDGAARVKAGLRRVEERAPAVHLGHEATGRRRWIGRLVVVTVVGVVIVWWLRRDRAAAPEDAQSDRESEPRTAATA